MVITVIDIVLAGILLALIVMAVLLDNRNARRNKKSKQNVREEITSRIKSALNKKSKKY